MSGFDIIYALQDEAFDREHQLRSIPVMLGTVKALKLSRILHALGGLIVVLIYFTGGFGLLYIGGALIFVSLLIFQHRLVKPHNLSQVNLAFGTTNGVASVIYSIFVCADIFLGF